MNSPKVVKCGIPTRILQNLIFYRRLGKNPQNIHLPMALAKKSNKNSNPYISIGKKPQNFILQGP